MALENVLAREFIEFAVKGDKEADAAIARKKTGLDKIADAATRMSDIVGKALSAPKAVLAGIGGGLDSLAGKLGTLAGLAGKISFGGGLGIGGILKGAMEGTVEAEAFGNSLKMLTKAVGDSFAPMVRSVTEGIQQLTEWVKGLDPELKSQIAMWAAVGTAVAGFVAILPGVIAGVGALMGVFAALVSPIGLIAAGIASLAVYFSGAADEGIDFAERVTRALDFVLQGWTYLKAGVGSAFAFISATMSNIVDVVTGTFQHWDEILEWFGDNWWDLLKDMGANAMTVLEQIGAMFAKFGTAMWDWVKSGFRDDFAFNISEEFAKIGQGMQRNTSDFPDIIGHDLIDPAAAAVEAWQEATEDIGNTRINAEGLVKGGQDAMNKLKKMFGIGTGGVGGVGGPDGFRVKLNVGFEGFQGSFDRLQKAFASPYGESVQQAQLGKLGQINEGIQKMAANGVKLKDLAPAVQ